MNKFLIGILKFLEFAAFDARINFKQLNDSGINSEYRGKNALISKYF
jgi:hypothetical protein